LSGSPTRGSHSLSESIDVNKIAQGPTFKNSAFIKEDVSSSSTPITKNSTQEPHPCDNSAKTAVVITSEETLEIAESYEINDSKERFEESIEVRHIDSTGECSISNVAFEISPSPTKFHEPQVMPKMSDKRKEELEEMGRVINEEQSILIQQHGRQERLASSITDQMYSESQV
jgi:hypothetical protein